MAAKKKATKAKKTVAKKQSQQTELVKIEKFLSKEVHKHHVLGLTVAVLLAVTAVLLLISYFSNNA